MKRESLWPPWLLSLFDSSTPAIVVSIGSDSFHLKLRRNLIDRIILAGGEITISDPQLRQAYSPTLSMMLSLSLYIKAQSAITAACSHGYCVATAHADTHNGGPGEGASGCQEKIACIYPNDGFGES